MEKLIEFENVAKLQDISTSFTRMDDAYLYSHITPESDTRLLIDTMPMKNVGTIILLVCGGEPFDIEINLEKYTLRPGSFLSIFPGTVVKLYEEPPVNLDAHVLYFDLAFLQNVNINMSAIALPPLMKRPLPVIDLEPEECDMFLRYIEILRLNAQDNANPQVTQNIGTSILAAMFYQLVLFHHRRIQGYLTADGASKGSGRRNDYVREFVKLVHIHHARERSVSFYADKLFISAKYLTLLVKEATGRSAAKWIDDFVIMEAKNMLRFSGKNIQQVAYALNFTTQSSFGKYFKHITGMSPTEYQKS